MKSWFKNLFRRGLTSQTNSPKYQVQSQMLKEYERESPQSQAGHPGRAQALKVYERGDARPEQTRGGQDKPANNREESSTLMLALLRKLEKDVLHSRFQGLDSNEAQSTVDFLDGLLDGTAPITQRERGRLLRLLSEIAQSSQAFPTRLNLANVRCDLNRQASGGGSGAIYKGTHGDRDVCVKAIHLRLSSDEESMKRFAGELALWSSMLHPNVQCLYGAYYSDELTSRLCLVSPWMEGGGLDSYLREFPRTSRLPLLLDIASGLEYMHDDIGIIHADLKTANVLVSREGRAVLSDFGLSTVSLTTRNMTTFSGNIPGTTQWMAPELLLSDDGVSLTKPSDMWSFGCVCYEVITGSRPFDRYKKPAQVIIAMMPNRKEMPAQYVPSAMIEQLQVPDDVWEGVWKLLIERTWAYEPKERQTASEAKRTIETMGVKNDRPSDEAGGLLARRVGQNVKIDFDCVLSVLRRVQ